MRKFLIITGVNTAREFQEPFNYKETLESTGDYGITNQKQLDWQNRESSLKEYRITPNPEECKAFEAIEEKVGGKITHLNYGTILPVGTKIECETNEELLTFYIL